MPEDSLVQSKPELELVLLIVSDNPGSTAARIAKLESIDEYRLIPEPTKILHDIYLDTPDHNLGKKRINLRIRGSGGNYWITLKVSPGLFTRRRHERQEVEIPWSRESLSQITGMLVQRGVRLTMAPRLDLSLSQVDVMRQMGLQIVQDRETERTPRNIVEAKNESEVLAELEIDSVLYHFERHQIRLYELELEAKSQKGRGVLEDLSRRLLRDYASELRRWRYGKLVTGEKIERLLGTGELDNLVKGSTLKPEGYSRIEKA